MTNSIPTTILRLLSQFDHYGTCQRCGVSWKYREHMQPIKYSGGTESFPLCQQCFDAVDAEQAAEFFEEHWRSHREDFDEAELADARETFYLGALAMKRPAAVSSDGSGERIGRVVGWASDGRVDVKLPERGIAVWMQSGDEPGTVQIVHSESGEGYAVPVTGASGVDQ